MADSGTTFVDLPIEIRNSIYALAGSAVVFDCFFCGVPRRGDDYEDVNKWHDLPDSTNPAFKHLFLTIPEPARLCSSNFTADEHYCTEFSLGYGAYFWVNRRSDLISAPTVSKSEDPVATKEITPSIKKKAQTVRDSICCGLRSTQLELAAKHAVLISQPEITKVSRQIRYDTLPIFYGRHHFVFSFFDKATDSDSILAFINTIGPRNARLIRDLTIVCRKKADEKYVRKEVLPEIKRRGVQGEHVEVVRLEYPFCFCETHLRQAAGAFMPWLSVPAPENESA